MTILQTQLLKFLLSFNLSSLLATLLLQIVLIQLSQNNQLYSPLFSSQYHRITFFLYPPTLKRLIYVTTSILSACLSSRDISLFLTPSRMKCPTCQKLQPYQQIVQHVELCGNCSLSLPVHNPYELSRMRQSVNLEFSFVFISTFIFLSYIVPYRLAFDLVSQKI